MELKGLSECTWYSIFVSLDYAQLYIAEPESLQWYMHSLPMLKKMPSGHLIMPLPIG